MLIKITFWFYLIQQDIALEAGICSFAAVFAHV